MTPTKALVTGATGFVGAAVARRLLDAGSAVRVLVRPNADRRNLAGLDVEPAVGALTDALKAPVAQLLGEDALLFKEKINFKLPGGDGFKAHQDAQAGWDAYVDFFVSALLSVDAATPENGCLQIVENYEHRGLFASWQSLSDADLAGMRMVDLPTEPGDVVFFDSFVPHGSQPNRSGRPRRIYYATYNRASAGDHMAQYYADKHASYPPDVDRDPAKDYVFRV